MTEHREPHWHEQESDHASHRELYPYVNPRLSLLLVFFVLLMGAVFARVYYLTVLQGPRFRESAEKNFLIEAPLVPSRGRIVDRNGTALSLNQIVYDVTMSPYRLDRDQIAKTLQELATILGDPTIAEKTDAVARLYPKWKALTLARNCSLENVLPLMERAFELPGISVEAQYRREYPQGKLTSHIAGYVGAITERVLADYLEKGYLRTERIGKIGIERVSESWLHGKPGIEIVTRDSRGRPLGRFVEQAAEPGHDVVLNLDLGMQSLASQLLGDWEGSIVVLDPRNGEVLAMVAHPTYDPTRPMARKSPEGDERYSTFNKAIQGQFAPGSTFKIVTAAAGLKAGLDPNKTVYCDGLYHLSGTKARFPCHLKWGHEWEDLYRALQHSCNVFFYSWAHQVQATGMVAAAADFGFGTPTGIDLLPQGSEKPGHLSRPGIDTIYLGNVLQMGIGQGNMIGVSPMQVAVAFGALCNGGTLYEPRLIREVRTPAGEVVWHGEPTVKSELSLNADQREQILEGLRRVTYLRNDGYMRGTAARVGFKEHWRVAGKTGTAQTGRKETDAWFCGFAPHDAPEIVIVVLVERSGHGGEVAAPLARQLLAYHFGEPEPEIVPPPHDAESEEGGD